MKNILSLFDGMSCGQIALKKSNIQYQKYYASEIDKHAIKVTQANYPNTIQLGDVTKWRNWDIDWSSIDLIFAGSPCQGFSFAGKQLAFDDPRSALFFVFVEILQHVKKYNPNVLYLLENVKMKNEHELVISRYMGVHPIEINSALLSAQNRVRLYWTNIANKPFGLFGDMQCMIPHPQDKGILLRDILESDVPDKYYLSEKLLNYFVVNSNKMKAKGNGFKFEPSEGNKKSKCITTREGGRMEDNFIVASRGRNPENPKSRQSGLNTEQILEPRKDGKSPTILARAGEDIYGVGGVITHSTQPRQGKGKGGKGHLMKTNQKSYCIDTGNSQAIEYNYHIRRLTPIECERLQTVPDNYTNHVSDSQRYKMLGNGWTIDVILYIISFIPQNPRNQD